MDKYPFETFDSKAFILTLEYNAYSSYDNSKVSDNDREGQYLKTPCSFLE